MMMKCKDCGRRNPEYYMLHHEVWQEAVPEDQGLGQLCLSCVEKRLDRRVDFCDFLFTPLEMYVRQVSPDRICADDVWGEVFGEDDTHHLLFYSLARQSKTLRELQGQILDIAGMKEPLRYGRRQAKLADQPLPDYEV